MFLCRFFKYSGLKKKKSIETGEGALTLAMREGRVCEGITSQVWMGRWEGSSPVSNSGGKRHYFYLPFCA